MPTYFCIRPFPRPSLNGMDYITYIRQKVAADEMSITLDDLLSPAEIAGFLPHYVSGEIPLGEIHYELKSSGVLDCSLFSPFSSYPLKFKQVLLGKGIADRVQLFVAEDILNRFSPDQQVTSSLPTRHRISQLERLGIAPETPYALLEYVSIIREHMRVK